MKKKLFDILPSWLKKYKNADKVAHVIYGLVIYLGLSIVIPTYIALAIVWMVAVGVEFMDSKRNFFDFFFTIILPTIIYTIFQ